MKNELILKGNCEERYIRSSLNRIFAEMRRRNRFTEDEVRVFLLNQLDFNTSAGFEFTYEQAIGYYWELTM